MSPQRLARTLTSTALLMSLWACSARTDGPVGRRQSPPPPTPIVAAPTPPPPIEPSPGAGAATAGGADAITPRFLEPVVLGRLAVFPVVLSTSAQEDPGPLMLLDEALEKGLAEVRELGADPANGAPTPTGNHLDNQDIDLEQRARMPEPLTNEGQVQRPAHEHEQVQQIQRHAGGAVVNTLVIENKSDIPIFVPAGTVVRGGKQDRQIGQDFVVDAKQTTPVDAFCVERGRWTLEREGKETGGRFVAVSSLANAKVRAAGQYKKDQSEVWDNVAQVNKAHSKSAASDTLLATLEAPDVEAAIARRSAELGAALRSAARPGELVGFAWAIDGRIQGLRYFAHTRVFDLVETKLARAVAADLITAEAEGPGPSDPKAPTIADLERFVAEVKSAEEVRHDTAAANENVYQQSDKAWASKTELKGKAGKKARALAWDYLAK